MIPGERRQPSGDYLTEDGCPYTVEDDGYMRFPGPGKAGHPELTQDEWLSIWKVIRSAAERTGYHYWAFPSSIDVRYETWTT